MDPAVAIHHQGMNPRRSLNEPHGLFSAQYEQSRCQGVGCGVIGGKNGYALAAFCRPTGARVQDMVVAFAVFFEILLIIA